MPSYQTFGRNVTRATATAGVPARMANVVVARQQHAQPRGEHVGARRRCVELGVEVVQQLGDLVGVVRLSPAAVPTGSCTERTSAGGR